MTELPPGECVNAFLSEAQRLTIDVQWSHHGMRGLDASYHAMPGKPGKIFLYERKPSPKQDRVCVLLSHEMVHVLQHWQGNLNGLKLLGWPVNKIPPDRTLSPLEQEAYTAEHEPLKVLKAVQRLEPIFR